MNSRAHIRFSPCLAYALTAALLWLGVSWALYPGLMAPDSLFQYAQAKSGQISNWHPPVMVYLWQLSDRLIAGPGGLYLLAMALYGLGASTLSFQLLSGFRARLGLCAALAFPAPLAVLMTVWKDALLLAALMAALSLLVWIRRRYHPLKLLAGLGLLAFATLLRHNAMLALLPLLWLFLAAHPKSVNRWCRSAYVAVIAALMLQLGALADAPAHKVSPIPMVAVWDLAALSIEENRLLLPSYVLHRGHVPLAEIKRLFSPISNVPLCRLEDGVRKVYCVEKLPLRRGEGLKPDKVDDLLGYWFAAVLRYPVAYLKHRLNVACHLLDLCRTPTGFNTASLQPDALAGAWYDGPPPQALGMTRFDTPGVVGQALIDALTWLRAHTVLLSPWVYLALLLVASVAALRPSGGLRARDLTVGLLLSAWLMALPLLVIAPNYQLRYLIWPMVVAVIATLLSYPRKQG